MSDETRNPRSVRRPVVAGALTSSPTAWPWAPNWISYRASLRTIDRREEVDPADVAVVCGSCGCEIDVTPEPHSPKCPTLVPA